MTPPPAARPVEQRRALLDRLAAERFDLLVIGGGITGAGVARDAALRGLRVALVERDDFASGTSSRSSRLVHGGVRYLEHGHLHLVFESSRERGTLLRTAPHLVRPLRFTWPVYRGARVPRWKLGAGLAMYDALALFRNVARHRRLDATATAAAEPRLARAGLVGGAQYYDASTDDARLTLATIVAAREAGAVVLNHAEVIELTREGTRVRGAVVRDARSGACLRVGAAVVVGTAGPWSDELRQLDAGAAGDLPAVRGTKGVHIALPRARVGNVGALTLLSPIDARVMFVLSGSGGAERMSIVGTTDTPTRARPGEVRASREDIDYLLRSTAAYFPDAALGERDVVAAWAGIRPLAAWAFDGDPASASREHVVARSPSGLIAVTGGKLTTYRAMGAEVVDEVERALGRRPTRSSTARLALPGGDVADLAREIERATRATGDAEVAARLVHAHGSRWRHVWARAEADRALGARLTPELPFTLAEAVHAAAAEDAWTLADVLVRRVPIAFATRDQGRSVARCAARVVGPVLGWDAAQVEREVETYAREVERLFAVER